MVKPAFLLLILLYASKKPDVEVPDHWRPLPPPRTGEWRDVFPETAQTFAEYKAAAPVRADGKRTRLYVQPFLTRPARDPGLLERIRACLAAFHGREARLLPARPLPLEAYDAKRRQVAIARLVPGLIRALPADGIFVLAVTDRDLFVGQLPYTYGWGSLRLRVGAISTARLGESGPRRLPRAVALALHESGHLLSIPHCGFFPCLMNGARRLSEADRRPWPLCPVCRAKLCWNLGLEPLARYADLERAYTAAGLPGAARQTRAAADATRLHEKG